MSQTTSKYGDAELIKSEQTKIKLQWGIILSSLRNGREVKLDHMDVLEGSYDRIVTGSKETGEVFMTFRREDILKQGVPQINHFKASFSIPDTKLDDENAKKTKLQWGLIVSAMRDGCEVRLGDTDVLEATRDVIKMGNKETGKVFMEIHSGNIGKKGTIQLDDFDVEILSPDDIKKERSPSPRP